MENLFYDLFFDLENLSPIFMVGAGVLLGILHAFEPDHIAAVGTQLIKSKNYSKKNLIASAFTKSSLIGIFWGAGHSTTILTIGILSSFLAISIQTEIFSKFELIVGGMLILLGIIYVFVLQKRVIMVLIKKKLIIGCRLTNISVGLNMLYFICYTLVFLCKQLHIKTKTLILKNHLKDYSLREWCAMKHIKIIIITG